MKVVSAALLAALLAVPAAARTIVVVSDLHLKQGKPFPWTRDFEGFLEAVASDEGVDLILNGDTFELLEASELAGVLETNREWLLAVRDFATRDGNRVFLVPGHTDDVLPAAEATIEGVAIVSAGFWASADGAVVVEHGSSDREDDLAWERAVYRRYEEAFPLVDDLAAAGAGIAFVLAGQAELPPEADLAALFRLSLGRLAWQQFRSDLEVDVKPPEWDVEAARSEGNAFVVSAAPEGTPLRELLERAHARGELGVSVDDLSDETVAAICDYRALVRRARRRLEKWVTQFEPVGSPGRECPRREDTRGGGFQYFWGSRDARIRERLQSFDEKPRYYVTAHTHVPHRPFRLEHEGRDVTVVGSGAFSRTLSPAELAARSRDEGLSPHDVLRSEAASLAACYPFVVIESGVELRYWAKATGESGFTVERSCP